MNNLVQGNLIGILFDGSTVVGSGGAGIVLWQGICHNLVGGTTAAVRNVISGNFYGIDVENFGNDPTQTDGNVIQGNFIGTDAAGTTAAPNREGIVVVQSTNTIIGGAATGAGNVISGNLSNGIDLQNLGNLGTVIRGMSSASTRAAPQRLANGGDGIQIQAGAAAVTVGRTSALARNVISGNGVLASPSTCRSRPTARCKGTSSAPMRPAPVRSAAGCTAW